MSDIYTDPPQSRNEAIIKSTIDGTQYTDPPQSRMEDLLLDLKEAIEGGGGGGTTVVANPEGEATDELEKIQVGSDIYGIPKDYEEMSNKPSINSVELSGNKTASELGIQPTLDGAQTVSGNPITVTDAEPMNAESVVVELEPKQDLHGYDAPWVGGAGKNKLPLTVDELKTFNIPGSWSNNTYSIHGVTFTFNSNGTILVNGVNDGADNSICWLTNSNTPFTPQEGLILSGLPSEYSGINFGGYNINYAVGNVELIQGTPYSVALVVPNSESVNNVTIYPMIRKLTESADFTPYSNICPITGYSEVNVERVGKNLVSELLVGAWVDGGIFSNQFTNYTSSPKIKINPSTTYTFACDVGHMSPDSGIVFFDENNNYLGSNSVVHFPNQNSVTFTTPNNAHYAAISVNKPEYEVGYFQLELGNTATTYEPYQGNTYTIDLDGTKYGGTLDVTEGGYSDEWGYIEGDSLQDFLDAGYTTTQLGSGVLLCSAWSHAIPAPSGVTPKTMLRCNNLDNVNPETQWSGNISGVCINNQGTVGFTVKDITTQEELDTWLQNNPLQIVFRNGTRKESTTPTDIPLLENTNNISTDGTNITLKYQPNNVIGECKAYTDEQIEKVLPPLPTTDGTYHLSCEVTSGVGVLSWASDS